MRTPLIAAVMLAGALLPALADDYPARPIHAITTTSAGGLSDTFMRALGDELQKRWGQPLIIENRPGGSMNVGTRACAEATPDGYTICITSADAMVYNQFMFKKLPFDPEKDLQPVTNGFFLLQELLVSTKLGVKNVDELCALSKQKPGTLSYLAPGPPLILYMETLKKEKGCDWVRVPFKGGGEAVTAILSGSTPIALFGEGNAIGLIRSGEIAPLVMMNNIRSPNFPNVPLLKETGYSGPPAGNWYGIFTPAGVPMSIVDKLSKEIGAIINDPDFKARHITARSLTPAANTPEQFAEAMRQERMIAGKVVRDAGFEPQ